MKKLATALLAVIFACLSGCGMQDWPSAYEMNKLISRYVDEYRPVVSADVCSEQKTESENQHVGVEANEGFVVSSSPTIAPEKTVKGPEKLLDFTFTTGIWSQFVLEAGVVASKENVKQSSLTVAHPSGLYGNLWWSAGLNDADPNSDGADEVDVTLGWAGEILGLDIDTGISYFGNFPIDMVDGDQLRPYFLACKWFDLGKSKTHRIAPFAGMKAVFPVKGSMPNRGLLFPFGLKHRWQISKKWSFCQAASLSYHDWTGTLDDGFMGYYNAGFSWKITDSLSWEVVSYKSFIPLTVHDFRRDLHVLGSQLIFRF